MYSIDCLLVYESGSKYHLSGGPILKALNGDLEIVGLHRGGFDGDYCCGTQFKEILKSISGKDYKPSTYVRIYVVLQYKHEYCILSIKL